MVNVGLAVVAALALLATAPLVTPAEAQVDMWGRHFDERDPSAFYGNRRQGEHATVGVGGVSRSKDHAPVRPKRRATKTR